MSEPSLQLLGSLDFVPDKCKVLHSFLGFCLFWGVFVDVREICVNYLGKPEFVRLKNVIQSLSEETSSNLKKNVYQNYMQFIDTAKEISRILIICLNCIISNEISVISFPCFS